MLLKELFQSPLDFANSEQDIDWVGDLKVFMDNDDKTLSNFFFPAVERHKQNPDDENAFKLYIKPLSVCVDKYCQKYNLPDKKKLFPPEKVIELAKQIAKEQQAYIKRGDYD